jgi:CRP-like cAMP-binding protein
MSLSLERLIAFLNSIRPLSPELELNLRSIIHHRLVKKKEILERSGFVCNNIYFIISGTLRCYYNKERGDITSWIFTEGDVVTAVHSFYERLDSRESIQAVENTEVYYITHEQLNFLYEHYPEFNHIGRILTIKYLIQFSQQLYNIRMNSSNERYQLLAETHPEFLKKVPKKHLASYLDMKPETFSRRKGG